MCPNHEIEIIVANPSQKRCKGTLAVCVCVCANWPSYNYGGKEGTSPTRRTGRAYLTSVYKGWQADKRPTKEQKEHFLKVYGPSDASLEFTIQDKAESVDENLKDAIDQFQDLDLNAREKTPLTGELARLRKINQKSLALICAGLSKSKASSNPDQAITVVEFGNMSVRLDVPTNFPVGYERMRSVLHEG